MPSKLKGWTLNYAQNNLAKTAQAAHRNKNPHLEFYLVSGF